MKITGTCGLLSIFCITFTFLQSFIPAHAFKQRLLNARSTLLRQKRQLGGPLYETGLPFLNRTKPNIYQQIPDSGPWGPWTQSSFCSRTCGGGVAYQERICLDMRADGSHSCYGSSRRYFSCNTVDCPPSSNDFRAEQCARFNTVPYRQKYYSWVPYHYAQSPCELYCMPPGGDFYARLDRKVTDGTRCRDDGSLDICVDAQCMPVGCDHVLGSRAEEDECGVCGGDGSTCRLIHGIYDETNLDVGYNDVLLIPIGSTSIVIEEVSPSKNYLAVRDAAGVFFLNGNFQIERPKDFRVAGTLFYYSRKPNEPQILKARGPTSEPLFIVLLYQVNNPGIKYKYSVPETTRTADSDSYSWNTGDFEPCSQTCGGGVQYRPVRCFRNSDQDIVDENLCDPVAKPPINQTCNPQPCPSGWHIGEWNDCSASCGGGSQYRLVFCRQGAEGVLPEDACEEEKPLFMRACNIDVQCPQWTAGEWEECDRSCGTGNQTRSVECLDAEGEPLDAAKCDAEAKPEETQSCNLGPCEGVEWIASDWSGCEGTCSPHMQSRSVHCANEDGVVFPDDACEAAKKPELTQACLKASMCEPMWHISQWTECSVECGEGVQSRVVFCGVWAEDSVMKIDDDKCDMDKKYEDVQNCSADPCQGTWFTGPWNRCSVPCGGGERSRKILCFHKDEKVEEELCIPEERPFSTEPCNVNPCDDDEMMVQGGCKDSKNGCCPDGMTPAGFNDEDCPKLNITGANTTCEEAEFGCCADNFTLALGPFRKGCPTFTSCNTTQHGCCPDEKTPASGPDLEGCDNTTSCDNTTFGCCPDMLTAASGPDFEGCDNTTSCDNTTFGCCPDMLTAASGPDFEGCDNTTSCDNTTFGCCPDMLTAASGPDFEGCDNTTSCDNTTFGCCPDMLTAASGPDFEGCENDTNCDNSTFGCCPDGVTVAAGPGQEGCDNDTAVPFPDIESSGDGDTNDTDCGNSTFGCCDDGITFARDTMKSGCMDDGGSGDGDLDIPCDQSTFGCCPDNVTLAKGFDGEGCVPEDCSNSTFGCCPDNTTSAAGPDNEGCFPEDCSNTTFGCCPDNVTAATGLDNEGCFPEDCSNTTFGCCPDNVTAATGLDNEGCFPEDCSNTTFGCCPDNVTAATGLDNEGCFPEDCSNTTFGCCPDNVTAATGLDNEGCFPEDCSNSTFGCCPDNITASTGPDNEGCMPEDCSNSTFGCCPDNVTAATGFDNEGCFPEDCSNSTFGCCPDNSTTATGPDNEGCFPEDCSNSTFGCCPDNATSATGPDNEGCFPEDCSNTTFGCCPDNVTAATGLDNEGCFPEDCSNSTFGCCPDNITASTGPDNEGCMPEDCSNSTFGCCPDNVTAATGFDNEGCFPEDCSNSTFGCCPDNSTTATGPDNEGCFPEDCSNSTFGCCPDNATSATGPDNEGCFPEDCSNSTFGCCPDNSTTATGPDNEGCFPEDCSNTTFGCCPDNVTAATGLDNEGCFPEDCSNTTFGCCPDNVTAATGLDNKGCFPEDCLNSTFGCCPDNITAATGPDNEGCMPEDCSNSTFGCCADNVTAATGENSEGCNDTDVTTMPLEGLTTTAPPECVGTKFGCCPDEITTALGPNLEGCCFGMRFGCCPDNKTAALGPTFLGCGCQTYPYKCCPDDITPAQGFNYYGCRCEAFRFGCCQDGETPATGPHAEGCVCQLMRYGCCPDGVTPRTNERGDGCGCDSTRFGCCPDGRTAATSADLAGCPCETLRYGCCPDGHTPARTQDLRDCPCQAQRYGCCLDGSTPARGPNYEGCPCETTRFGCCGDRFTPAQGPDQHGCPCDSTLYGCCADGYSPAKGPKYEGCPDVSKPQVKIPTEVCSMPKELGPCKNYTVMWYFDVLYGSCSRFWYGGCDGNGNKFSTVEECENTCIKPEGPDACLLPKTAGSCSGKILSWYYDVGSKECETFTYGGCLGNNNRFVTKEACEQMCISLQPPTPVNVCDLKKDEGSCNAPVIQWYYNTENSRCEQFYYMGCKGNANRFAKRIECEKSCLSNLIEVSEEKEVCRQPQKQGTCSKYRERWYFDYEMGRCHTFLYSGCDGNDNNFATFAECEKRCAKQTPPTQPTTDDDFNSEYCFLSQDPGPCNLAEVKWYYDSSDGVCKKFHYGGCLGNQNKFRTRKECDKACFEAQDVCSLPMVKGPCSGSFIQWYFDKGQEDCIEFQFTGCEGNGNRFNSKESCYQKCKKDKLTTTPPPDTEDVCSLPQQPGPCLGYLLMWYYNSSSNMCKSFVYGGCDGNDNRFEQRTDCENRCVKRTSGKVTESPLPTSPPVKAVTLQLESNEDVCRLPVDPGACNSALQRYFYDAQTQACLPFVYSGCGGNKNRFKTSEICLRFCTGIKQTSVQEPSFTLTTVPTQVETQCPPSNCANIHCSYGIEESFDPNGCTTCRCSNPCENLDCPEGSRCAIDSVRTSREGIRTEPVCRRVNKPGQCPSQSSFGASDCQTRCRDDANCRGEHKCCNNGCAMQCVAPAAAEEPFYPPTKPEPARIRPGPNRTVGRVGDPATLPCDATGWPSPTVTWWRETTMLPLSSSRFETLPSHALLIRSVVRADAGDYQCHAHNGVGSGAVFVVSLVIDLGGTESDREPDFGSSLQTRVSLVTRSARVGAPLQVDCAVEGGAARVTWSVGGVPVREDDRIRVLSNHTLLIAKAARGDQGEYRCTAEQAGAISQAALYVEIKDSEDSDCEDNPQFSSCARVVEASYCSNESYRKFCCRSCLEADSKQESTTFSTVVNNG